MLRIAERRSRFRLSGLRGRQFRFERGAGRLESRALGGAFLLRDVADVLDGAIEEGAGPVNRGLERLDALVDGRPQRVEILSERFPEVGGGNHRGFDLIRQPIVGHKMSQLACSETRQVMCHSDPPGLAVLNRKRSGRLQK